MAKIRHPVVADLEYAAWGTQSNPITNFLVGGINVIAHKQVASEAFAFTQRPAIARAVAVPNTVTDRKGRGSYFWEKTNSMYIVNGGTVYSDGYSEVVGTITGGLRKVTILELSDYLIILDAENGEGWTIDSDDTLVQITDADFPETLAGGGAVLNQSVYVMDTVGTIYRSALNDPTSWNALDIITAEREPDPGLFLTKHKSDLVAVGTKTIEFFYDNGNPVGSPLNRREEVSYRVGGLDPYSFVTLNDVTVFIGVTSSGEVSVYKLDAHQIEIIANPSIGGQVTSWIRGTGIDTFLMAGGFVMGHILVYITPVTEVDGTLSPSIPYTLTYDATTQLWHPFTSNLTPNGSLPIVQWTDRLRGDLKQSAGITVYGDLLEYAPSSIASDYVLEDDYVASGYVEIDYVEGGVSGLVPIPVRIIPQIFDGTVGNNKFMHKLELWARFSSLPVGTAEASPFHISWYDDDVYGEDPLPVQQRPLLLLPRRKLTRLGKFNRRVFVVEFEGPERFLLWGLELDFDVSGYA